MIEIYNSHMLNNKQRFYKSILFGILAALGCAVVFSLFVRMTNIQFFIFYVLTGYVVSKVITETGRGVGKKFAFLGAGLTFLSIVFTEIFIYLGYDILLQPNYWFSGIRLVLNLWSNLNSHNLMTVFFMAWGVYIGYSNSSIANF